MSQNGIAHAAPVPSPSIANHRGANPSSSGHFLEGIRIAVSGRGSRDSTLIVESAAERERVGRLGVIEDLTASLRDTTAAVDARTAARRDAFVVRMVRFGAAPILVAALLNIVQFHRSGQLFWSWALGCACFNGLLGASTVALTFTSRFARKWRPVTFLAVSALVASDTVLGTVGHEPKLLFISLILLMVGTGSLLPWSIRLQLSFNLLCLTAWVTQTFWVPSLDGLGLYKLVALSTAAALAWFSCYARHRYVREHEESERAVRESEGILRQIFDANTDGITLIDLATRRVQVVNEHFLRISGFSREEVIGKTTGELDVWGSDEDEREFVRRIQNDGAITNMEVSFRAKDGRIVPCLFSSVMVEIGGRPCVMTLARDIAALSEAQARVRRSEETFRKLFDSSLDAMSVADANTGEYFDVNPEFVRSTGFSREEIIGANGDSLNQWANADQREQFARLLIEKGEVRNMQADLRRKDGSISTALTSGVRAEINGRACWLAVTRNISELKAAEDKLRKSETMLRAIFDNSPDAISLLDLATMTLAEANAEMTRIIGYSRDEMMGKTFAELVPVVDPARHQQLTAALKHGEPLRNFEINFATRYGTTWPALLSAAVVMLDGRPHMLSVARDITELVEAREAALAASKAKSEFLSTMSHEIRTPMNAILGMADLLGESELNSEQRRYLDTVLRNGNGLLELINSILDLARVESGRLSLESVEFDLVDLTEHAADTLAVRAHEKGVELAMRFEAGLPASLMGDPYRLRQILNNLIGNAIKFTGDGQIVVSVARNQDATTPGNFLFAVHDTGIGIAPENLSTVFANFTQADASTTRNFGGSGLGLAIVQRLVGLMGGRVWVESELGKGSAFFFTADLRASLNEVLPAPVIESDLRLRDLRVLIAGENSTARGIVGDLVRAKGCIVAEADSEADALAAIDVAARAGASFGLMVVDCESQSADGFEKLRRISTANPHAPVIALMNSYGLVGKLRQMRERGVEYYCLKPIKRRDLYKAIAEATAKVTSSRMLPHSLATTPAPSRDQQKITDRPLRILLADDSPDNRLLVRAYIKKTSYLLIEAENGQIAVDRFATETFDLVLMDIQMPVLDGYSAVRMIREWETQHGRARTPILALTASALDEDVRRAKEAGCDMHVSKPVKKSTLLDAIAYAMENYAAASGALLSGVTEAASPPDFHI